MSESKKAKILIIDDEQINLEFFNVMLSRLGFEVFTAASGEEGLEIIEDTLPPFDIHLMGHNEGGATMSYVIKDVILTNTGTTFSVDDMMLEETFTYIARTVQSLDVSPPSYKGRQQNLAYNEVKDLLP